MLSSDIADEATSTSKSLSERLNILREENRKHKLSIGKMVDVIGREGFGVLLLFLSMPSALPIPAAGYSTPFGIAIVLLGTQMVFRRRTPWLPHRVERIEFGKEFTDKMLNFSIWFLEKFEHWIKPRFTFFCRGQWETVMGILIVLMACLMILPIPLTNTAPAMVIFFMALGLTENDGICCALATALAGCAVIVYAFVIYMVVTYGISWLMQLKDVIFGYFGFN